MSATEIILRQSAALLLDCGTSLHESADFMKAAIITEAMERTGRNQTHVARGLRIHRNTLAREIKRLHLQHALAGERKNGQRKHAHSERNFLSLRKAG